ncbi:MAG: hypothetical protein EBY17_28180 [Acidobacteriia bacterium]|nr:hypothetical protein [Terriglobia bacterium]
MRQTAVRHPVGSFLAICTSAGLHRTPPANQPSLRIVFLSHAEWMQRGTGRISVHFTGPFTINHEVWWFLEGWLGRRFTAAQKRRGVDCAAPEHGRARPLSASSLRTGALERLTTALGYPAGGTTRLAEALTHRFRLKSISFLTTSHSAASLPSHRDEFRLKLGRLNHLKQCFGAQSS